VTSLAAQSDLTRGSRFTSRAGGIGLGERAAFQQAVLRALQLPRIYWEVFVLCDIQDTSVHEAARILGIDQDLATKRLRRARQLLAEWRSPETARPQSQIVYKRLQED
jgi:DNA-directed RNA polymerase specialized sigma24 family protein